MWTLSFSLGKRAEGEGNVDCCKATGSNMGASYHKGFCSMCKMPKEKANFACSCLHDRLICADCANSHRALASDSHRVTQSIDIRKLRIRTLGLQEGERGKLGTFEAKSTLIQCSGLYIFFNSIAPLRESRYIVISVGFMYSQWVWMDESVFGCGYNYWIGLGEKLSHLVFEVKADGTIIRLPKMLKLRYERALCWHSAGKQVLAFGGSYYNGKPTKKSRNSARLTWHSTKWQHLPKMRDGRKKLTACEFQGLIYLCGGADTGSIELFDPCTLCYLPPLSLSLPPCGDSPYLSVVDNNQLIVICERYMIKFRAGPRYGLIKLSKKLLYLDCLPVDKPPLVGSVNGLIYVPHLPLLASFCTGQSTIIIPI